MNEFLKHEQIIAWGMIKRAYEKMHDLIIYKIMRYLNKKKFQ